MTFTPWEEIRDELDAKHDITEEDKQRDRRVTEAYVTGYRLAELHKQPGVTSDR